MKLFLTRVVLFLTTFSVLFILTGALYLNTYIKKVYTGDAFRLPDSLKTVFFGDSHALTAFDPRIIPATFNAAKNSESYFQTYQKLKAILKANPQIEKVVLSYSYHNISIALSNGVLYGDVYYYLLNDEDKKLIQSANNGQLLRYYYGSTESYIKELKIKLTHFSISNFLWLKYNVGLPIGAFKYKDFFITHLENNTQLALHPLFQGPYKSTHSNLNKIVINNSIKSSYFFENKVDKSDIMIEYLFKMAQFCQTKKVDFILVNTPLHSSYKSKIPKYYFQLYNVVLDGLKSKYDNISYLDFTTVNFPDSLFGDGDHLNYYGIQRFSNDIKEHFN